MEMKAITQIEAWKAIRKLMPPKGRVERPIKGGGYRRRPKHRKLYETETL
jgi:hypothetical protein